MESKLKQQKWVSKVTVHFDAVLVISQTDYIVTRRFFYVKKDSSSIFNYDSYCVLVSVCYG